MTREFEALIEIEYANYSKSASRLPYALIGMQNRRWAGSTVGQDGVKMQSK